MNKEDSKASGYPGLSRGEMHRLPRKILAEVKAKARRGDPEDVLRVIDEYCWNVQGTMNVGDVKGAVLDKLFTECNPVTALELGSYLGYSAVRMARLFKEPGSMLYCVEADQDYAKVVKEMVEHAGLSDKVTVIEGTSGDVIPKLLVKHGLKQIDFAFIDHVKDLYKEDVIKLERVGLFRKGSVIAADNVIYPGCPDYLEYIRSNPKYESIFIESQLEYRADMRDGIERSVYLGRDQYTAGL